MHQRRMSQLAVVAVATAAVAFGTVAAPATGSAAARLTKQKVVKIANNVVSRRSESLRVASARTAGTAANATNRRDATNAANAKRADNADKLAGRFPSQYRTQNTTFPLPLAGGPAGTAASGSCPVSTPARTWRPKA